MRRKLVPLILILFFSARFAEGQESFVHRFFIVPRDTNYISSYLTDYTTRLYGSVKYSQMGYNDHVTGQKLAYGPNNKLLLGFGVNHGILGLNIGINFPFVNNDNGKYGKTKYYDFTIRTIAPRFNATLYLQYYKGFYLKNTKDMIPGWEEGDQYYIRGDILSRTIGLELAYIFNNTRFSYRAAVLQNEWQKKSAGTLLAGGNLIYNTVTGDSSIVPTLLYNSEFFEGRKFDRSNNFTVGPMIGYAYTLVIKKHFFLLGSVNGSGNIGYTQLLPVNGDDKVRSGIVFGYSWEFLVSAGYNSDRWYFGTSFTNISLVTQGPMSSRFISYDTGMFRFNLVRRFATKKPIRILNAGIPR